MAYRKTEKVLAQLEARRNSMIASAIDVIAKSGIEGLTTDAVAVRAGLSVGLLYHYFPDKTELLAAVLQQLLERDRAAMKEANSLADALAVLFNRVAINYRLMSAVGREPIYREGMKRELARLIRSSGVAENAHTLAAAVYGAIFEAAGLGVRVEQPLIQHLAKLIGAPTVKSRTEVI